MPDSDQTSLASPNDNLVGATKLYDRAHAACQQAQALAQVVDMLRIECERARDPVPPKELLQRSRYARLLARMDTMPVIEQAKGILMAQSHCGEAEAFDMLRRASQRSNVPVRELAAGIVARSSRSARTSPAPVSQASSRRAGGP